MRDNTIETATIAASQYCFFLLATRMLYVWLLLLFYLQHRFIQLEPIDTIHPRDEVYLWFSRIINEIRSYLCMSYHFARFEKE